MAKWWLDGSLMVVGWWLDGKTHGACNLGSILEAIRKVVSSLNYRSEIGRWRLRMVGKWTNDGGDAGHIHMACETSKQKRATTNRY